MAQNRTIGNIVAPPRFLAFMCILVAAVAMAGHLVGKWPIAMMAGFNLAALIFLLSCIPLLRTHSQAEIGEHARRNDANRGLLLAITAIVLAVLLVAVAAEAGGRESEPMTKVLIIITFVLAWFFSNTVYALHYAHMGYHDTSGRCAGFRFPDTPEPSYWDFLYFAFTCGMAFATSDVIVTDQGVRKVVMAHCLAAFTFNIGVLAFTVNLLASGRA